MHWGRPEPAWVGERFVAMRERGGGRFGLHRGTGRGFRAAVEEFARHRDPRRSGNPDRAGNGAAMRIAPIGTALSHLDDGDFARAVAGVSILTHREPRAVAAALAVARSGSLLFSAGASADRAEILEDLARWTAARETELGAGYGLVPEGRRVSDVLRSALGAWAEGLEAQLGRVADLAGEDLGRPALPSDGYALASPVAAILIALRATSFEDAVVRAVNLGGDADTVGAMVGGLAGAAWGLDAIPDRWRRIPGYEEVLALARYLAGYPYEGPLPDLMDLEERLSARLAR